MNVTRWAIYVCPDCGHTGTHAPACGAFPNEPVEHGNRVVVVPDAAYQGAVGAIRSLLDNADDATDDALLVRRSDVRRLRDVLTAAGGQ